MTPLELKVAFRTMQAEITALRDRVGQLEAENAKLVSAVPEIVQMLIDSRFLASKPIDPVKVAENVKKIGKLCPHCGEKPARFFHVKNCPANKKNKGSNGEVNRN
jgi:hypothetical protein